MIQTQFVTDCGIVSKKSRFCRQADLDRLFIALHTRAGLAAKAAVKEANKGGIGASNIQGGGSDEIKKALGRCEFLTALVHIAINKYIRTSRTVDCSDAVQMLLRNDIQGRIDSTVYHEANIFRATYCYTEAVSLVLAKYEPSLRRLFLGVSATDAANMATAGQRMQATLMSFHEWRLLLRQCNLQGIDLSERDGKLCFAWARMCVKDSSTEIGKVRESNLPVRCQVSDPGNLCETPLPQYAYPEAADPPGSASQFEGFLEAICRLAVLKALPTDVEIEMADQTDAGTYLLNLKENDESAWNELLSSRCAPWPGTPSQPMHQCVEHMISIIIRTIEHQTRGLNDMGLTQKEVDEFCKPFQDVHKQ